MILFVPQLASYQCWLQNEIMYEFFLYAVFYFKDEDPVTIVTPLCYLHNQDRFLPSLKRDQCFTIKRTNIF